ncbi:MAG TPA: SusC/RagA family TonB-linked outer membrane protein, partial [Chloroflexota bacterium]|nr:SusC/RagA family TonB-linked outer membrane protein [Chloroflexota bacterium]
FNMGWINELKVRGSWGQLGNADIPGGAYPQYVGVNLWVEYMIGNQIQVGPTPASRLSNPELTWETNTTMDFGFETSLFNNSIDFAATYYTRDTENFLVNIPVPVASGFTSAPFNVGLVRNSGLELEAGYNTRIRDAVDLTISGNLTTVNNELVALTEGIEQFQQAGFYRTSVGQPIGYFYGFQTCGVFQTEAEAAASPRRPGNQPGAGDLCFRDLNADTVLNDQDRMYLGKTIPDAFYGINLNAGFRGFDLTAFFTGVTGVQRFNALRAGFGLSGNPGLETMGGGGANQLTTVRNRWTPTNPSNTTPRAIAGDPAGNNRLSDRWVEDGDFLRLKTLQLGYTLPDNLFGTRTRGTRLYVSATNLWTLTDYSGLDPEFSSTPPGSAFGNANNQSQLQAGTDFGNIPQPRMFQIGVTTTF